MGSLPRALKYQRRIGLLTAPRTITPKLACLLAFIVFAVFARTLGHGYLALDDRDYLSNPYVGRGLTGQGIAWALTNVSEFYWHPVTWLSHMADFDFFGQSASGRHGVSVAIHALNTMLLLMALYHMTGNAGRSLAVAALFGLHPLRVESVAWIAERKDVLAGFFFIAGLIAYDWYRRKPGWRRFAAVTACYVLAIGSKPTAITFPFVLVLLDYWPLKRLDGLWPAVKEKALLFAIVPLAAGSTFIGQQLSGAVLARDDVSVWMRVANALLSYVKYIGKSVWPHPLTVFYPYDKAFPMWQVAAAAALLAGITWVCWLQRERRYLLTGWLWFLGVMTPMVGFVQVGVQAYADRFTYLPAIGLAIAVVWLASDLAIARGWIRYAPPACAAILAVLAVLSWRQAGYWQSSEMLFVHTLAVEPRNPLIQNNLGNIWLQNGRVDESIPLFREAIAQRPNYQDPRMNLGIALIRKHQFQEAGDVLREGARLHPDSARPHVLLGLLAMEQGDEAAALGHYLASLKLRAAPDEAAKTYNDIGMILARQRHTKEAIPYFREALRYQPGMAQAHQNLANCLLDQNQPDEAVRQLRLGIQVSPDNAELKKFLNALLHGR